MKRIASLWMASLVGIVAAIAVPVVFLTLTALFLTLLYTRFRRDRLIGR